MGAFYCLNHIPRDRLALVLRRIESWLRQGGLLVASFGTGDDPGTVEEGWFGRPMYFSGFDADHTLQLLRACGLHVNDHRIFTQPEHGRMVSFLWVVATRGRSFHATLREEGSDRGPEDTPIS